MLYLSRAQWIHGGDVREVFDRFATRLGLDVARFDKDMDGKEAANELPLITHGLFLSGLTARQWCSSMGNACSFVTPWRRICERTSTRPWRSQHDSARRGLKLSAPAYPTIQRQGHLIHALVILSGARISRFTSMSGFETLRFAQDDTLSCH